MGPKRVGSRLGIRQVHAAKPGRQWLVGDRLEMQNVRHIIDVSHHMPESYEACCKIDEF